MSNNSSTSLMAKNISSYATIGSAFLGGLVGFFIGKSMGPDEEELVESSNLVSPSPSPSEPSNLVSSSEPLNNLPVEEEQPVVLEEEQVFPTLATSQQVIPVSETAKEAQQAVLNPVTIEQPIVNPLSEPTPLSGEPVPLSGEPVPSKIEGGKTKTRRSRKHHKRSSRKYIGGQATMIVPPSS